MSRITLLFLSVLLVGSAEAALKKKHAIDGPTPPGRPSAPPGRPSAPPAPPLPDKYKATILNPENVTISAEEREIIHLTNEWRIANNLKPLVIKKRLMTQARDKSKNMAAQNKLSHDIEPKPTQEAENIAMGYADAAAVFTGWKNSPGHNANMLNKDLKFIGVGGDKPQGGRPFHTQVFCF